LKCKWGPAAVLEPRFKAGFKAGFNANLNANLNARR